MRAPRPTARIAGIAFATAVLCVFAAGWCLSIATDESRSMVRHSPDSWLLIPSVLRGLPEVGLVGVVTFHSSCGDGPKPASEAVWYDSAASTMALRDAVSDHLRAAGFIEGPGGWRGANGDIEVTIVENRATRHLEVWHFPH